MPALRPSGTLYYYHDQNGSTRALADATGTVAATYTYDAYGRLSGSTGSVNNPFRYAGQYTDAESGYQYLRDRYYDPGTAQFLTRDPVVARTRTAYAYAYAYAGGNPLTFTDPGGDDPVASDNGEGVNGDVKQLLEYGEQACEDRCGQLGKVLKQASKVVGVVDTVDKTADAVRACLQGDKVACMTRSMQAAVSLAPADPVEVVYPTGALTDLVLSELDDVRPKLERERREKVDEINRLIACNPDQLPGMSVIVF